MPYTTNIPQANDQLSQSQNQILQNFQALAPCVGGIFVQQGAALGTAATELAIYNLNLGGVPQLYLRKQGGGTQVPFTVISNTGANYTAILPSGIVIKFGTFAMAGVSDANCAYDVNNALTHIYTRTATMDVTAGGFPAVAHTLFVGDYPGGAPGQLLGARFRICPVLTTAKTVNYITIGDML